MTNMVVSGGYFVLAMREAYALEAPEYENLEPTMKQLEEEGRWKMVSRARVEEYMEGLPGLVYVFQI